VSGNMLICPEVPFSSYSHVLYENSIIDDSSFKSGAFPVEFEGVWCFLKLDN
jgi:hypothetical protein